MAEHGRLGRGQFQGFCQGLLVHAGPWVGSQSRSGAEQGDVLGDDAGVHGCPGFRRVRHKNQANGRVRRARVPVAYGDHGVGLVVIEVGLSLIHI